MILKNMLKTAFMVGIGGGIGSICRYLIQLLMEKISHGTFPWGTFAANITGCLIIGIIYAFSDRGGNLSPEWRIFFTVGLCGGFTTFSSFAYNNLTMLSENNFLHLFGNIFLNLFFGIFAVYAGIVLIKLIFR